MTQKKLSKRVNKHAPPSLRALAAECEKLRAQHRAQEASAETTARSYRDTVATVSHDIRNPLSVIFVSARMLTRTLGADAPGRKHMDAIVRAAEEINQLAQDLVDAACIERGALSVASEPQDARRIVDQAIDAAAHVAAAKSIEVTAALPAALPRIAGDMERLVQVLACLIVNAIRFTPKGGRVRVSAARSGAHARFSVADTGPGLRADQMDQVFSRRGADRRPTCQAVGLGPYVARGIVLAHGGEIWVQSEPGAGTDVRFTIPLAGPRSRVPRSRQASGGG